MDFLKRGETQIWGQAETLVHTGIFYKTLIFPTNHTTA